MLDNDQLSWVAVALVLGGVAALATAAAGLTEARGAPWLLVGLAVVWLVACVLIFAINPTTWPLPRT